MKNSPISCAKFAGLTILLFGAFFGLISVVQAQVCCKCLEPNDPKTTICIKTMEQDCSAMPAKSANKQVTKLTCPESLGEPDKGKCKAVAEGGICITGPAEDFSYSAATATSPGPASGEKVAEPVTPPTLGVQIPGLQFVTEIAAQGGYLQIPFIAQYIDAVYKYMVGIAAIAAAIMIVYGGFLYIVGASGIQVQQGKTIILDATIGLLLILGAYTILSTINPDAVTLRPVKLSQIKKEPFDAAASRALVERAAAIQAPPAVEMPVIDLTAGPAAPGPAAPTPEPTAAPQPGEIAKDALGNLIAQGACPHADMVPIRLSDDYVPKPPGKQVQAFCIDRYEAPNQPGEKPFIAVNEWEADWYCQERGKRLCSESEWIRACLGPKGQNLYGYGPKFIPGPLVSAAIPNKDGYKSSGRKEPAPCNYDTLSVQDTGFSPPYLNTLNNDYNPLKEPSYSTLNPENPRLKDPKFKAQYNKVKTFMDKVDETLEPSGNRKACKTADEGVFDMLGNTQEIVLSDKGATLTFEQRINAGRAGGSGKPYRWMNFYWAPIAHLANTAATPICTQEWGLPHGVNERYRENGFRCCLSLSEK